MTLKVTALWYRTKLIDYAQNCRFAGQYMFKCLSKTFLNLCVCICECMAALSTWGEQGLLLLGAVDSLWLLLFLRDVCAAYRNVATIFPCFVSLSAIAPGGVSQIIFSLWGLWRLVAPEVLDEPAVIFLHDDSSVVWMFSNKLGIFKEPHNTIENKKLESPPRFFLFCFFFCLGRPVKMQLTSVSVQTHKCTEDFEGIEKKSIKCILS